jgi:hypothetical protein
MNTKEIEKYTETEIQNGKTHQEIFNKIVSTSDFNIHEVADIVRKIPTLEKRRKYKLFNNVLAGLLGLSIISRIITGLGELIQGKNDVSLIVMLFPIITILLFWGIYTYKRNLHLVTGLFMTFGTLMTASRLFNNFDILSLVDILVTLFGSCIALYLNSKLPSDYVLDKELKETKPDQRVDSLKFTE